MPVPDSDLPDVASTQQFAAQFLRDVVAFEGYTSETITEDVIRRFISEGTWDDTAGRDELRLVYSVVLAEIAEPDFAEYSAAHQSYLRGAADTLTRIMLCVCGHSEPYADLG